MIKVKFRVQATPRCDNPIRYLIIECGDYELPFDSMKEYEKWRAEIEAQDFSIYDERIEKCQ